MVSHDGGGPRFKYGVVFFRWLDDQLLIIEDYGYVDTDFRGHPDLALLVDD